MCVDASKKLVQNRVSPGHGSLREWGVSYRELPLAQDGQVDLRGLEEAVRKSHRASCAFDVCNPAFKTCACACLQREPLECIACARLSCALFHLVVLGAWLPAPRW